MPRPRRRETETVFFPHEYMAFADRRTDAIVRRCCLDQNIVESVQRSCYLHGVEVPHPDDHAPGPDAPLFHRIAYWIVTLIGVCAWFAGLIVLTVLAIGAIVVLGAIALKIVRWAFA
jgi:hypothetical protein